jgi:hypothetical protein
VRDPRGRFFNSILGADRRRDLRTPIVYRRKGELSLRRWLRSWRVEKPLAIHSRDDRAQGAAFTLALLGKMWQRVRGETVRQ